jgi:tRNA A37 threonylcarbamoyltransferase TsaD
MCQDARAAIPWRARARGSGEARNAAAYRFPKPLRGDGGCDFSFSGLKTAVRLTIEQEVARCGGLNETIVADVAASFQATIGEILAERVGNALTLATRDYALTAVAVAGGVAANQAIGAGLRRLAAAHQLPLVVAPPALCTDNAAMIAWAGMERLMLGQTDNLDFEPRARWPLGGLESAGNRTKIRYNGRYVEPSHHSVSHYPVYGGGRFRCSSPSHPRWRVPG